ncbi:MAG: thioredoxin domain-containing protein [Hyphomicrobiales bacterium]
MKNHLADEGSPYLRQHSSNPVNWYPWGEEAFRLAEEEDKLLLISIGYSTCHWCHVMAKESFEDSEVATYMNKHFICVKVDREERPDIDQLYMDAVQLLNSNGGWPLNCFALPNGKPIWGGTYFKKDQWMSVIQQINDFWEQKREDVILQAENLKDALNNILPLEKENIKKETLFTITDFRNIISKIENNLDKENGGTKGAPKFILPANLSFLLRYAWFDRNDEIFSFVHNSLVKIASGGIYDQIQGGFSRYSVDEKWKVPHFEKMLYDNAQLISLYSEAFAYFRNPLFKKIVEETIAYIEYEMMSPHFSLYSAIDADSEGKEGSFYLWKEEEINQLSDEIVGYAKEYFGIGGHSLWKDSQNILSVETDDRTFASKHDISYKDWVIIKAQIKRELRTIRQKRVQPDTDTKVLTSWNALMVSAFVDAAKYIPDPIYIGFAKKTLDFIVLERIKEDGSIIRCMKNNKETIKGFLDDYANTIKALIDFYEISCNEEYLETANKVLLKAIDLFYDDDAKLFFYSPLDITAKKRIDIHDSVIPSANSVIGRSMFRIGSITNNNEFIDLSSNMLKKVKNIITEQPLSYGNWLNFMADISGQFYICWIKGAKSKYFKDELLGDYIPNKLVIIEKENPSLYFGDDQTMIQICNEKECLLRVNSFDKAIAQMKRF